MEVVMGIGDEIIATRHAAEMYNPDHRPVRITDANMNVRQHDVWLHNHKIDMACKKPNHLTMQFNSSCRPYINYKECTLDRWSFNSNYSVKPGEIYLSDEEKEKASKLGDYVIIEPTVKGPLQINKSWPIRYWEELVQRTDIPFVQLHYKHNQTRLDELRVSHIFIGNIREWLIYVSHAIAVVTTDGGLHHTAAAFRIPAVVLFSGFISPSIMGYEGIGHVNLCYDNAHNKLVFESCGLRTKCQYCEIAMNNIKPSLVKDKLLNLQLKDND